MASQKEYLEFILDQFSDSDTVTYRAMMGEFLLYYRGRLFGGIYDNRLLIKPVPAAIDYMKPAQYALPYPGGKEMLMVENVDDRDFLSGLLQAMYPQLPEPKK